MDWKAHKKQIIPLFASRQPTVIKWATFIPMHLQIKVREEGYCASEYIYDRKKIKSEYWCALRFLKLGMIQMDRAMLMARKHVFPILPQAITFLIK